MLAAISFDGGAHFSTPIRVNRQTGPAPPLGTNTVINPYDDVSWVTLTNRYAYFAWGEWRVSKGNPNREINAWMARIPLGALSLRTR